MIRLRKFLHWLDENCMLVLTAFLFAFIPLFPKLPLFDALPGYIVRVRVEDFFVFFTAVVWLIQGLRKKIAVQKVVLLVVSIYAAVGFFSLLMGIGLLKTIPFQLLHIGKSALHYFRYLEYFMLLFFAHSAIKTKKHLQYFLIVLAATVLLATVYGYGQKYLHWPLYSTMNREYSKGEALYLTEFARIQSTFAGHYDLAAYLVLVLPILLATALAVSQKWLQICLHIAHLAGVWLLFAGSSKSSLVGYAITILLVLAVHFRTFLKNGKGIFVAGFASLSLLLVGFLALVVLSPEAYKSLAQLGKNVGPLSNLVLKIDSYVPAGSALKLETQNLTESGAAKPDDVYVDVPDLVKVATVSATGETTYIIIEKERTWSENALKYGLSLAIRLDTLWPQALRGFVRNPLTGSAYATLNKEKTAQYTEADSTDNNFLRVLGETGILGFVSFFGVLIFVVHRAKAAFITNDILLKNFSLGFLAGTVGLLINAITIDVFAASKVAFTYWALSGLIIGSVRVLEPSLSGQLDAALKKKLKSTWQKYWTLLVTLLLFFFLVHQNPFTEHSPILNFASGESGALQVATARCISKSWRVDCINLAPKQAPYAVLLVPFLWLYNNPGMYYYLNLALALFIILGLFKCITIVSKNNSIQLFSLLMFVTLPSLRHTVDTAGAPGLSTLLLLSIVLCVFAWALETLRTQTPLKIEKAITACTVALGVALLSTTSNLTAITQNFADEHTNWAYPFLKRVNTYFYDYTVGNTVTDETEKPLIITAIDPHFVSLFSNTLYNHDSFASLSTNTDLSTRTFISDFGLENESLQAFQTALQQYDVSVEDTGCNTTCTIFELHPNTEKVSATPITWRNTLDLSTLPESYTFSVVSQRFGDEQSVSAYGTKDVASILRTVTTEQAFSFILGDSMPNYDAGQTTLLSQLFLDTSTTPLIFVPGNEDIFSPNKPKFPLQTFFVQDDFFLLLQPQADGSFSHDQQIEILNALYDLDKIPGLKNVFILMNQAAWVGSNKNEEFQNLAKNLVSHSPKKGNSFFISTVIPFLETRQNLSIFILSGDSMPTREMPVFSKKVNNIHYLSSAVYGTNFDHFLTFSKQNGHWYFDFVPLLVTD